MKILNFILITFALLLTSCASNSAYINKAGAYVTDIKLYDDNDPDNTKYQLNYKSVFQKSELGRVSWEICLSINNPTKQKINFPITALYHRADSIMFLENSYNQSIEADWATCSLYGGWGWDDKGNWEQGQYFIDFYSGTNYLGRRDFEIIDDMNLQYIPVIDSYLESIKLFESGEETPKFGNRHYKTEFKVSETRYVNWELNLQHMFRDRTEFKVHYIFYDMNGEVFGEGTNDSLSKAEWHRSNHNSGWGYEEIGKWYPGKYHIEIYIDDMFLSRTEFEIVDDTNLQYIPSVDSYLHSLKLFESGKDIPGFEERVYKTEFEQSSTRYIYWELYLKHQFKERTDFKLHSICYDEKNVVVGENTIDSFAEAEWPGSIHISDWGFETSGLWQPGKYYMMIYSGDDFLGRMDFTILNDTNLTYVESLDAYIHSLKLFSMSKLRTTEIGFPYSKSFKQQYTGKIGWDLSFLHPLGLDKNFELVCKIIDSNGKKIMNKTTSYKYHPIRFSSNYMGDLGNDIQGRWKQGKYRIELFIDDELVASAPFEIVE